MSRAARIVEREWAKVLETLSNDGEENASTREWRGRKRGGRGRHRTRMLRWARVTEEESAEACEHNGVGVRERQRLHG